MFSHGLVAKVYEKLHNHARVTMQYHPKPFISGVHFKSSATRQQHPCKCVAYYKLSAKSKCHPGFLHFCTGTLGFDQQRLHN